MDTNISGAIIKGTLSPEWIADITRLVPEMCIRDRRIIDRFNHTCDTHSNMTIQFDIEPVSCYSSFVKMCIRDRRLIIR